MAEAIADLKKSMGVFLLRVVAPLNLET